MVEIKSIEIDGVEHTIKDETARTSIESLMSDLQELIDRVSAVEKKAPLKIDEVTLLAEKWQLEDDGYYTLKESGTLKAYVYWEDGSKDIIEKKINITIDE